MIDYLELKKKGVGLVKMITGLDDDHVIIANQNISPEDMPDGLYATVNIIGDETFGASEKRQESSATFEHPDLGVISDIVDITERNVIVQMSVNFFRSGAVSYASSMQDACRRRVVSGYLWANELGWQRTSPVRNLTGIQNAGYEERAQIDLFLYAKDVIRDTINRGYQVSFSVSDSENNLTQGDVS